MRLRLYSIHDRLLSVYLSPFPARGDVDACRQVSATLRDPAMSGSQLVSHPADYVLCYVGTFDDESGGITLESHAAGSLPAALGSIADIAERYNAS